MRSKEFKKQTNKKKPNPKQSALHSNQLNVIHSLILKKKKEPEMSPHTEDKCCLANWVICIKDEVIQLANQEASLPIMLNKFFGHFFTVNTISKQFMNSLLREWCGYAPVKTPL